MKQFGKNDHKIVKEFLCKNTRFYYKLNTLYDQFKLGNNMYRIGVHYNA